MLKIVNIIIFIFISFSIVKAEEKYSLNKEEIKRTVLILPFLNKNGIKKYDYLGDSLMKALKAGLIETNKFILVNSIDVENKIKNFNLSSNSVIESRNAVKIAKKIDANVVIVGSYIIFNNKILVQIEAIDVFTKKIVAITNMEGDLGIDLLRIIDDSSKDITSKMLKGFPLLKKSDFNQLISGNKNESIRISGIILTCIGGTLFLVGTPILIYDLLGYSSILMTYKKDYEENMDNFEVYNNSYITFMSLFISSIATMSLGVILTAIGIPLLVIKFNKKISLNIELENNANFFISYKF